MTSLLITTTRLLCVSHSQLFPSLTPKTERKGKNSTRRSLRVINHLASSSAPLGPSSARVVLFCCRNLVLFIISPFPVYASCDEVPSTGVEPSCKRNLRLAYQAPRGLGHRATQRVLAPAAVDTSHALQSQRH